MKQEEFYNENKLSIIEDFLLRAKEEKPNVDEFNQVFFFGLCYQSSDMNGNNKYCANYDNDGADYGFYELVDMIESDYHELVDNETYHKRYWVVQAAHDVANEFFEKFNIKSYFSRED